MKPFRSTMERHAWDRVKGMQEFHWSDLATLGVHGDTAQKFVRRWERAGLVKCIRKDMHRKIFRSVELDAANLTALEAPDGVPTPEGNMWRAMRRLVQFGPTDLAAHANAGGVEVTVEKARAYCRQLLGSGHLKVRQTAIIGRREAIYQLIDDSGPFPPKAVRLAGILDPNTGAFSPAKGGAA
ncbi:hypothetical protein rosmuc_03024 [Roseovarius mucosus DSM 17069]|uniref:Uncharacterized protein n=1 Tax=Roseovarius mucosus DSM 17069 TaxID=1288298 RepID=A0A0A0HIG1_9RHOB|nr:hypothetical protein [Roseovarius mucosus]KGM86731.1 hypothetical protein rosmuc_03024 [Roseovarius mucosus DSM 17069]